MTHDTCQTITISHIEHMARIGKKLMIKPICKGDSCNNIRRCVIHEANKSKNAINCFDILSFCHL